MKSQLDLLTCMIREFGMQVGYNPARDIRTATSRHHHEGDAFLEVTLPRLDDLLLSGLSGGSLPSLEGWKPKKGRAHPEFLNGFWSRVFLPDGRLSPTPCIVSVRAIRQISRSFKKINEVCSGARVDEAITGFVSTDLALSQVRIPVDIDTARSIAHFAFGGIVGRAVTAPGPWKHGPGAVAEGFDSLKKWSFPYISERIEAFCGADQFRPTWESLEKDYPVILEVPARLIAVPKTAVKPRLISIEPSYNQYIQQGYHTALKDGLGRVKICQYLDQTPNQRLAALGSVDGALCTIDLSEASDRVHMGIVRYLFSFNPSFREVLENTRSRMVKLPDGRQHILNKYASMGSSLTFPVETMVFTTLVLLAICEQEGDSSRKAVRNLLTRDDIRVYGDDIIVPSKYYQSVVATLERYGLKVNQDKSFETGLFRESCGADFFMGVNVTPVYVRRRMPHDQRDAESLVSYSSFRNQWVSRYGYGVVQEFCDSLIKRIIEYPALLPTSEHELFNGGLHDAGAVARVGYLDIPDSRWNVALQRSEVRVPVLIGKRKLNRWTDSGALMKCLTTGLDRDPLHLTHHGRPVSAILKHRWRETY